MFKSRGEKSSEKYLKVIFLMLLKVTFEHACVRARARVCVCPRVGLIFFLVCVDASSKRTDMIPLKHREQTTATKALKIIPIDMEITRTVQV